MNIITANVGHGALAIVRHGGEAVLVDARIPPADATAAAYVKDLLTAVLKNHYVKGVIFTGFQDAAGDAAGAAMILRTYRPDWVMYPKYYQDNAESRQVFALIKEEERARRASAHPLGKAAMRLDQVARRTFGGLSDHFEFELFSPHIKDKEGAGGCDIVLKLTGRGLGGFSYLITGNTESERWEVISGLFGSALKADVLAAPNHGSRNGAHPGALAQIAPHTVLISAGVDNPYGHPDPEALAAYRRLARYVISTSMAGGVSLLTQPGEGELTTTLIPSAIPSPS